MAQVRLYSDIIRGFIEYTGNTLLGLDTGFAYSLTQASPAPPGGTWIPTTSWRTASSSAFLTGLSGSTVKKAYLVWMTTVFPDVNGSFTNQDISVTFTTPLGSNTIAPNAAWSQFDNIVSQQFNIRVADVTSLVQSAGTGMYTLAGAPTGSNYSGWTLAVVWANPTLVPRFISIDSFCDLVNIGQTLTLSVGGFITPPTGPVNGRSAMVIGSAESNTSSGQTQFGPSATTLIALSGPNNDINNFFQSQINNANSESASVGLLDTTGTFGNNNQPLNSIVSNARWHWDQTNVSINPGLTNSQTQGYFRFGPVNNAYLVHLLSLQIDAQSPTFTPVKTVNKAYASPNDTIIYTVFIKNDGNFGTDNNLTFFDTIPTGTSFVANSFTLDGTTIGGANPQTGVNLGSFSIGQGKTVQFSVTVNSNITTPTTLTNSSYIGYTYTPALGLTFNGSATSNSVNTFISYTTISSLKTTSKTYADLGNTITYTIVLNKSGDATPNSIVLIDTLATGLSFIPNSLTLNGVTQTGLTVVPPSGFSISSLPNGVSTVTFNVLTTTIPLTIPITNQGTLSYKYTLNPSLPNGQFLSTATNIVATTLVSAPISFSKAVNKAFVHCNDTVTYTIVITNTGNIPATSVLFKDTIPNGATFINNSLAVDGVIQAGINPQTGLTLNTIAAGRTLTITYSLLTNC